MAVIDFEKKEIRYCDSMGGSGSYILNSLLDYLVLEYKDKKNGDFPKDEWNLKDLRKSIPQQNNCCDCGAFTCVNSILSSLNMVKHFPFDILIFSLLIIAKRIFPWFASILCIQSFMVN